MDTKENNWSLTAMVNEVVAWFASAPDFLKAERIQEEGVVHRPRADETGSLVAETAALFAWFEAAPTFVKELFGTREGNNGNS